MRNEEKGGSLGKVLAWTGVAFGLVALVVSANYPIAARGEPSDTGWVSIFNGKNLDGWYSYLQWSGKNNDSKGIFRVEHGMVHVFDIPPTDERQEFGYIATEKEYSNYQLRLEYKWGAKQFLGSSENSAILVRDPRGAGVRDAGLLYHFVGSDKVWPRMVECQIAERSTGDTFLIDGVVASTTLGDEERPGGRRFWKEGGTPYTGSNSVARSEMREKPGWNTVEIVVQGDRFTHIINGKVINRGWDLKQPDPDNPGRLMPLTRGRIMLQAEGAEVFYRNIRMQPLD